MSHTTDYPLGFRSVLVEYYKYSMLAPELFNLVDKAIPFFSFQCL